MLSIGFLKAVRRQSAWAVAGALFLFAGAGVARAATYTYTGNANYGFDSNGVCTAGLGGPGADSANWSDPRNWGPPCAPAGVPGAGDDAMIGDFTVILGSSATIHNLTFSPTPPTGGRIGNAFDVTGGSTLTVTGAFTWTAGTIGYPAGHSASSGGIINIASGAQWIISSVADKYFFETNNSVINDGDAIWSGGNIHLYQSGNNGIVNNGTFTTTTDANLVEDTSISLDPIGFVNNGTFRKTAGSGITNVTWAFTNHGVVNAQSGTIALSGGIENGGMIGYGHIHTGAFTAAAGATVDFAGNTHVLSGDVRFTGAGRVRITGGVVQTAGNPQIGTPNAPGNFEIAAGGFNPGGNTGGQGITPTGGLVCSNTGTVYLTGGNIGGPITVQSRGNANWTGGELDGIWNIASGGTLNINGTGTRTLQGYGLANYGNRNLPGILNNAGTTIWSGTCKIDIQYGDTGAGTRGAINNSGTFIVQNDQTFTGSGTFTNTGIVRKQNSSGVTNFGESYLSAVALNNRGTLDVRSGVLSLNAINHNLRSGTVFSGAGRTRLSSGSVTATGNFSFANSGTFELAGGNLTAPVGNTAVAPAAFGGTGTFLWTGGEIDGVVNVGADAKLNISGTAAKMLNGYGKANYGNVNQPGLLNNAGTAIWTGTGNVTGQYGGAVRNLRGGTFNVQTNANFGTDFHNGGTLNIGAAAGITRPGVFKVGGSFTQTSTGVLNVKVGGAAAVTQFDQLQVQGSTTLGGTLNVSLINGFHPAATTRFKIISGSYNGRFAALNGPFTATYAADGVYLTLNPNAPTISSFTPASGLVGSIVTINGTNLTGAAVSFNGVRATVNTAQSTSTRLVVAVPTGATSGPIRVVTSSGSVISASNFTVTQLVRYTVSGHITSGTAPIPGVSGPVPNVTVYSLPRVNLPVLAGVLINPDLLPSASRYLATARTNAAGQYVFNVLPSSYYFVPALVGVSFNPTYRVVTVTNSNIPSTATGAGVDFAGASTDAVAPNVNISSAATSSTGGSASGTASDSSSGVLTVVVTLQNANNQYLVWDGSGATAQFSAAPTLLNYAVANGSSGTPIFNSVKVSSQSWTLRLPANLPTGSYRLTVRSIDRALRISLPVVRVITKSAITSAAFLATSGVTLSSAAANASSDSISLRFNSALDADDASDAGHYIVTLNGQWVDVETASYNANTRTVVLSLSEGSLHSGDTVSVNWSSVLDVRGQLVTGQVGPLNAR